MIEIEKFPRVGKGFGIGILFSWDNFKGVSICLGSIVINIGNRVNPNKGDEVGG